MTYMTYTSLCKFFLFPSIFFVHSFILLCCHSVFVSLPPTYNHLTPPLGFFHRDKLHASVQWRDNRYPCSSGPEIHQSTPAVPWAHVADRKRHIVQHWGHNTSLFYSYVLPKKILFFFPLHCITLLKHIGFSPCEMLWSELYLVHQLFYDSKQTSLSVLGAFFSNRSEEMYSSSYVCVCTYAFSNNLCSRGASIYGLVMILNPLAIWETPEN